ncbi:MAG: HAD family hydrolase, partial [Flavobacteriia bacterium]|nr:HAD family hydrolase [Flavobacteriia bacterium]
MAYASASSELSAEAASAAAAASACLAASRCALIGDANSDLRMAVAAGIPHQ